MNRCLIILAAFTIFSGCFCKVNPEKLLGSTDANLTDNLNTSTRQKATKFPNVANKSLETNRTEPKTSNHDEIKSSEIIVNTPEDKLLFSEWKHNLISKIKQWMISFFDKLDQEEIDLNKIKNEFDYLTNSKLKRQDNDDFIIKTKQAFANVQKAIMQIPNVVKPAQDNDKKVASRNTPINNNNNTSNNTIDKDDLRTEVSPDSSDIHQHTDKIQDFEHSTPTAPDTYIKAHENKIHLKINKHAIILRNPETGNNTNSKTTEVNQITKEETNIISKLDEPTAEYTDSVFNNSVAQEEIQTSNVVEAKTIPSVINITLKFIDKNTEYFFGEESTEKTTANIHQVHNKNDSMEMITGTGDGNSENHQTITIGDPNECKDHGKGSRCNDKDNQRKKRRINQNNSSEDTTHYKKSEIFKTPKTTLPSSFNQSLVNNISKKSAYLENTSKNIDKVMVKSIVSDDSLSGKDWLWQHLGAVKNNTLKSKEFFKTHHFLLNSGDTEKSVTAALELSTASYKNIPNKTDLITIILLNKIPNLQKEPPLKRIKRDNEKDPTDAEVSLPDDDESATTTLKFDEPTSSIEEKQNTDSATSKTETLNISSVGTGTTRMSTMEEKSSSTETTELGDTETVQVTKATILLKPTPRHLYTSKGSEIKITVPQTNKVAYPKPKPPKRGSIEKEWNDGGGIRSKPLLLLVTVPSFVGIGLFIIILCFLTRNGGWCCRLFNPRAASQTSLPRDTIETIGANRPKYYH